MAKTTKPVVFTGTLYSFPLQKPQDYGRKIDMRIESFSDLKSDLAIQLNEWIRTLAGRIKVSIATQFQPFDEFGTKQAGNWLVASLFYSRIGGAGALLDTILLGPIDPVIYEPKATEVQTIETQINTEIKAEKITALDLPESLLHAITKDGQIVPIMLPGAPAAAAAAAAPQPATAPTPGVAPTLQPATTPTPGLVPTPISTAEIPFGFSAPTIPPQTPAPIVSTKPTLRVGGRARVDTGGAGLNQRSGGGLGFSINQSIPNGTELTLEAKWSETPTDGFIWYNVRYLNRDGWVAGLFLVPI